MPPTDPLKALVLAAGEGTRLRPLTLTRPKPMVPIDGEPLLAHIVAWLRSHGIEEIALNVHYRPDVIEEYFGDGSGHGVRIRYSREETILGTAGALSPLRDFFAGGPFVVAFGDVLTDLDLGALLARHIALRSQEPALGATLALYAVPNPTEVGLVERDETGRITRFVEKPAPEEVFTDMANAGILVAEPVILDYIPRDTFFDFGHDLFPRLLEAGVPLYGWPIPPHTYLLDIGSPEKYARAQREWPLRQDRQ